MPQQAMLAQLWDLLDDDGPAPPVSELLDLHDRVRACQYAIDHPDEVAEGVGWLARRFQDICQRRMAGKPICAHDVHMLIRDIVNHARYRKLTLGEDPYVEDRDTSLAVLERIAAAANRPAPTVDREWRRRQRSCFALLSAAVTSPATARTLGLIP